MNFTCPVCKNTLTDMGRLYRCENGHSFDKSKYDYVNLLQSNQSSSKRHGDDRLMIRARRDFLSKGYYSFLLDELIKIIKKYSSASFSLLDAGCGECYYSMGIREAFSSADIAGVDISKDALEFAHKRGADFPLCVASLFSLPFGDESFDFIINCFSPAADKEYSRVLKKGGILIRVVPLERHLFSLKAAIYDNPYLNEKPIPEAEGFEVIDYIKIKNNITLESKDDIQNLFKMTPYYYKTSRDDQLKTEEYEFFETEAAFGIIVLRKSDDNA